MPGKVNPVIPEVVTQVAAQVIGNDAAITAGGMQGHFELNVFVPMLARNLLDSVKLLSAASRLLAEKCVDGIEANREQCEHYAELTLSAATALNPYIGYDAASEIVKEAAASGRSLREVARERALPRTCSTRRSTIARWQSRTTTGNRPVALRTENAIATPDRNPWSVGARDGSSLTNGYREAHIPLSRGGPSGATVASSTPEGERCE